MKHRAWLLLLPLLSLLCLQCGYRLAGRGRNLPAAAQTIAIPEFKNETPRYQAEHFVTVAIREEFIRRSRLRLSAAMDKVDLLLEGRISAFETSPVAYTSRGTAHLYELRITVNIRLIDLKQNELVYEGTGLVFRESFETAAGDFFSQEPGALNKLAAKFAASIVTSILDNF
jgi:TolB-like protein